MVAPPGRDCLTDHNVSEQQDLNGVVSMRGPVLGLPMGLGLGGVIFCAICWGNMLGPLLMESATWKSRPIHNFV